MRWRRLYDRYGPLLLDMFLSSPYLKPERRHVAGLLLPNGQSWRLPGRRLTAKGAILFGFLAFSVAIKAACPAVAGEKFKGANGILMTHLTMGIGDILQSLFELPTPMLVESTAKIQGLAASRRGPLFQPTLIIPGSAPRPFCHG